MGKKKVAKLDVDSIEWHDDSIPAARFLKKFDLPQVAKLNSGNYGNFGCGTEVNVSQPFLLHTARHCTKVISESVTWDKHREKYVDTGNQIVIPTNYPGWFAYSKDDNSKLQHWTHVKDVSFHNTKSIVSCQPITCYVQSGHSPNGERVYVKKICPAGEVFELGDRYVERTTRRKPGGCCFSWASNGKIKRQTIKEVDYVLARDSANVDLLIPMSARGVFCKIGRVLAGGRIEAESVYKMSDLLEVIELPCYVELVHGKSPSIARNFTGMLRLDEAYKEETVIACSLGGTKFTLLEFPVDSEIEFIPVKNNQRLLDTRFLELANEHCLEEVLPYIVSLKVIQNFFSGQQNPPDSPKSPPKQLVPPPLPTLAPDDSDHEIHPLNDDQFSDEFTDDETVRSHDAHYEIIPFDRVRGVGVGGALNSAPPHAYNSEHGDSTQEDTYLVPVRHNPAIYSNIKRSSSKRHYGHNSHTSSEKPGAVCPANSIINGADDFFLDDTLINKGHTIKDHTVLKRLPPVGRERMDRFLQDSLEELNRIRLSGEVPGPMCPPVSPPVHIPKPAPEMKAKLDAFLDEIFDCDTLERGQLAPRIIASPPEKKQSTPNLSIKRSGSDPKPPLLRSLSDVHLQNGNNLSVYLPSTHSEQNGGHLRHRMVEIDSNDRDNNNDSSSSSRSASDIYRQMKYPQYHHSGSLNTDYPYPRTDSGIFVSPRFNSSSERGSSRNVYHAMSEMSWKPPDDIHGISVEEVALSLLYIGLKQESANLFSDQQIDGQQFLDMDENLLVEGFPELNALERKKVLDFKKGWRPKKLLV